MTKLNKEPILIDGSKYDLAKRVKPSGEVVLSVLINEIESDRHDNFVFGNEGQLNIYINDFAMPKKPIPGVTVERMIVEQLEKLPW